MKTLQAAHVQDVGPVKTTRLERSVSVPTGAGFPLLSSFEKRRLAAVALLDEVIDQFAGGIVHLHVEGFHLTSEVVEGHNRGDGN